MTVIEPQVEWKEIADDTEEETGIYQQPNWKGELGALVPSENDQPLEAKLESTDLEVNDLTGLIVPFGEEYKTPMKLGRSFNIEPQDQITVKAKQDSGAAKEVGVALLISQNVGESVTSKPSGKQLTYVRETGTPTAAEEFSEAISIEPSDFKDLKSAKDYVIVKAYVLGANALFSRLRTEGFDRRAWFVPTAENKSELGSFDYGDLFKNYPIINTSSTVYLDVFMSATGEVTLWLELLER